MSDFFRFLGSTGIRVSPLCFGTMTFGSETDQATSSKMFSACRDHGLNFFDCADVYGDGRAEQILGDLTQSCRDEVVITSKFGYRSGRDPNAQGASVYHMFRSVEASLKRLRTDRIDLYFIHRPPAGIPLQEVLRGLEILVQHGKILYPALSNLSAWQSALALGWAEANGWRSVGCLEPMYNLAKRQAEVEILPLAQARGLGVICYSPLGGGLLTGKYDLQGKGSGRLAESTMYSSRYGSQTNFELATRFAALARDLGYSPAALAVAWAGRHPAVTAPIIGARNLEQLNEILPAAEIKLTTEEYKAISLLSPAPPPANDRNDEIE